MAKGPFIWKKGDPRTRIIPAGGLSKGDLFSALISVYMQRIALGPWARTIVARG